MRFLAALLTIVFAMAAHGFAQERPMTIQGSEKTAIASLKDFSSLVAQQGNYREMGFESRDELDKMALGDPLQVFMVRLDMLQKYQQGSDPEKMLSGGNQVMYPVTVDRKVRSSVTLAAVDMTWKAVSFGSPAFIRQLSKARSMSAEVTRMTPAAYFAVEVPSLNLFFLAHRSDGRLMLTPILDDAKFGFTAGVPLMADKVFGTLVPSAKEHDGLPR